MAQGWLARRIAITVYTLSAVMCGIARLALKCDFRIAFVLCLTSVATLLLLGLRPSMLKQPEETHATEIVKAR